MITRTPVTSSQIKSIGYDTENEILVVEFLPSAWAATGMVYEYAMVPRSVYAGLLEENEAAKLNPLRSVGKYFSTYVKKAGYDFKKLGTSAELAAKELAAA